MRIILCGGGTGGHVSPAIAIAEYLKKCDPDSKILFVGREGGDENDAVVKANISLEVIRVKGLMRNFSADTVKSVAIALHAKEKAHGIIKKFKPDAVLGTGGYVSWPVMRAAQEMKIPTLLHESNATPGLVTKLLAPRCDRILLNFSGSDEGFKRKEKIRIVGNPVRDSFSTLTRSEVRRMLEIPEKDFLISSSGGSGGSEKINSAAIRLMTSQSFYNKHVRHIHSTGKKYYADLSREHPDFISDESRCRILPYVDNMAAVMAASDIVISRCGAMTLSELSACGACAILIPSPNVTGNHQYKNAKLFCDAGAAVMIEDSALNERTLTDAVRRLLADEKLRKSLSRKIRSFYQKNSAELIWGELCAVIDSKQKPEG